MTREAAQLLRLIVILFFLSGLIFFVVNRIENMVSKTSGAVNKQLDKVLAAVTGSNTHIVEGRAEIGSASNISELALLELNMNAVRTFENSAQLLKYLPLGTKKVIIRAHYKVKAGYKLSPHISLFKEGEKTIAQFPPAEVLSVELIDFEELESQNGWANKLTGDDRAWLLRQLHDQMIQDAQASGMLLMADAQLHTRLSDLLGSKVEVKKLNLP